MVEEEEEEEEGSDAEEDFDQHLQSILSEIKSEQQSHSMTLDIEHL